MSRKPKNHYLAKILGVFLRQKKKENKKNKTNLAKKHKNFQK